MMKISLWEAFKVEVLNSLYICKHETWSVRLHLRDICATWWQLASEFKVAWRLEAIFMQPGRPAKVSRGWGPLAALVFCATHPLYITVLYRSLQMFTVVLAVDVLVCFSILMYSHFRNAHRDYISCLHVFTNKVRARRQIHILEPLVFSFPVDLSAQLQSHTTMAGQFLTIHLYRQVLQQNRIGYL